MFPFVGLGIRLRARGHRVTVLTSGYFEDLIRRHELDFFDTLPKGEFLSLASNPLLWHPLHGARTVFRSVTRPLLRQTYDALTERYRAGDTVAVSSCLGFSARIAHERLGMPLVSIDLQPAVLWSLHHSPALYGVSQHSPRWFRRWQYWIGERFFLDPCICPTLNAFRHELDLPPIRKTTSWWHSPQAIVGMFPAWYAPPQPDWPSQVQLTQFPLWNEHPQSPLDGDIEDFLDQYGPPLVFTPGSANLFGETFFQAAVKASLELARPALLVSRFSEHLPANLPPTIRHVTYAPFDTLLPRTAAIIHHGGIGTTAQSLAAGIPQLVMPLSHDQPDNAARLKKLQVGDSLTPANFKGPAVADRLGRLLQTPAVANACREAAARFVGVDPYRQACDIIEAQIGTDR